MAAPMPKSDSFWEKRGRLGCLVLAYLSVVERPCIYSECLSSLTVTKDLSHWGGGGGGGGVCFLI